MIEKLPNNPYVLFTDWYAEALEREHMADAMYLATVDHLSMPNIRTVLLKDSRINDGVWELVFYTNHHSVKANELQLHAGAAICFFWSRCYRQVRCRGQVCKITDQESDAYFSSRPKISQAAACISPQSQVISSRVELVNACDQFITEHQDQPITRPLDWGGYAIKVTEVEFWLGQTGRLHDRFLYTKTNSDWKKSCLAP